MPLSLQNFELNESVLFTNLIASIFHHGNTKLAGTYMIFQYQHRCHFQEPPLSPPISRSVFEFPKDSALGLFRHCHGPPEYGVIFVYVIFLPLDCRLLQAIDETGSSLLSFQCITQHLMYSWCKFLLEGWLTSWIDSYYLIK